MIWLAILLFVGGVFMASQNIASRVAFPFMVAGGVLLFMVVFQLR